MIDTTQLFTNLKILSVDVFILLYNGVRSTITLPKLWVSNLDFKIQKGIRWPLYLVITPWAPDKLPLPPPLKILATMTTSQNATCVGFLFRDIENICFERSSFYINGILRQIVTGSIWTTKLFVQKRWLYKAVAVNCFQFVCIRSACSQPNIHSELNPFKWINVQTFVNWIKLNLFDAGLPLPPCPPFLRFILSNLSTLLIRLSTYVCTYIFVSFRCMYLHIRFMSMYVPTSTFHIDASILAIFTSTL